MFFKFILTLLVALAMMFPIVASDGGKVFWDLQMVSLDHNYNATCDCEDPEPPNVVITVNPMRANGKYSLYAIAPVKHRFDGSSGETKTILEPG